MSSSFIQRKNGDRNQEVRRLKQPCLGGDWLTVVFSLVQQCSLGMLALMPLHGGGCQFCSFEKMVKPHHGREPLSVEE